MPGLEAPTVSSLDRLKALDTLANLDAQLEEAQQLCTHSARAEMIAKWLLGRLQTSAEVRQSAAAWDLLLATLRILPPERVASILGISKILKTLQTAAEEFEWFTNSLASVAHLLEFLLQQSKAPTGAALQAGLSLPAPEAARFTGAWLRSTLSSYLIELRKDNGVEHPELFIPALEIWGLRKRSSEDNALFSEHCMVSCSTLVLVLKPHDLAQTGKKRLHGAVSGQCNVWATAESLLARHIFLVGRAAFFKAQGSGNAKKVGSQRPAFTIESLLGPLRQDSEHLDDMMSPLPQLLEIALKSAPAPSPTQRVREKPWVEALFLALHDLNPKHGTQLDDPEALCGMLAVLAQRSCTVSAEVLTELVHKYAGLGNQDAQRVDWNIIAAVVEVDATVFKDVESARSLFDAITAASIKLGEEVHKERCDFTLRATWKDGIVVPILTTFARFNDFQTGLELCSEQLMKDLHGTFWSVWADLDEPIQELLEKSLTGDQAYAACQDYCRIIQSFKTDMSVGNIEELSAAIVMLNAVIGGIHSEATAHKLQRDLENAFVALMELHGVRVGAGLVPALRERRFWALITSLFEVCFPRWAIEANDATALATKIEKLVPRSMLDRAVKLSSTVHPEEYGSVEDSQYASDARCFAACVCTQMLAYKGRVKSSLLDRYAEVLNAMGRQCKVDSAARQLNCDPFVLYPAAIGLMDAVSRQDLLRGYVPGSHLGLAAEDASNLDVLRAVGSTASTSPEILDDLVTAALARLDEGSDKANESSTLGMAVLVDLLSPIASKTLTRIQRERILDRLCECLTGSQVISQDMFGLSVPLMLRLMELPNPTARICLEPALLSKLARGMDEAMQSDLSADGDMTICIESLVSLVIQQCIRTKDQDRSKAMLVGLSSEATDVMKSKEAVPSFAQYSLVKSVLTELEASAVGALRAELSHRKPSTVKKLVSRMAKAIEKGISDPRKEMLAYLELLKAIPPTLASESAFDLAPTLAGLATFMDQHLDAAGEHQDQPESFVSTMMVRCYQILGRFATTSNIHLALFADGILRMPLEPRERAMVLATFESMIGDLGASRGELISELLSSEPSMPASRLTLLQLTINKSEKADFEGSEGCSGTKPLHKLLMMVSSAKDFTLTKRALVCVADILKTKPFMANQYNIETTLQVLHQLAQRSGPGKTILYLDICATLTTLLLHHRSRLQGRFHMVVKLLQALLTRLFQPLSGWDNLTARRPPAVKHAQALSRLLKLFCEPPHQRKTPSLVDESRREQAHVGTFVLHVLHHYCAQILHGTLGEGMRDALTPGLRAMIEAMEMGGAEGGKALSAGMTGAERVVLRGLYEGWRRFGKWRGG